jgi:hypothetical protein
MTPYELVRLSLTVIPDCVISTIKLYPYVAHVSTFFHLSLSSPVEASPHSQSRRGMFVMSGWDIRRNLNRQESG